jgi:F-type H+-transporting ATPase subunit b
MKFDLWTILFQIINFVVLLFILKRLLYRPIREIMQKRKELVEKTLAEADAAKNEARMMREKCEREMEGLNDMKAQMADEMKAEVEAERERLLEEAKDKAHIMVEKEKAILEKERKKFEEELKETAVEAVSVLAARLLRDLSDGDLQRSIYGRLMDDTGRISSHIMEAGKGQGEVTLEVSSAYPLSEDELDVLRKSIESQVSKKVVISTSVDDSLIAGAKVSVYDTVFDTSLKGQIEALKQRLRERP